MARGRAREPAATARAARAAAEARVELARLLARRPELRGLRRTEAGARRLVEAATEHGLLGALLAEIARRGEALPGALAAKAAARGGEARLWQRHVVTITLRLADGLRAAGVRCAVLKGPLLAERLWGDAAARESVDVDLLVEPAGLPKAEELAAALGYGPWPGRAQPWHRVWVREGFPRLELHVGLSGFAGTELGGAGSLGRAREWRTATGADVPVLALEDELIFLAVHVVRHRFERLAWEADLFRFVTGDLALDWGEIDSRAREAGVGLALAVALARVERAWAWDPPRAACAALAPHLRARIAERWLDPLWSEGRLVRHYRGLHTATANLLLGGGAGNPGGTIPWLRFVAARLWDRATLRYYRRR
jgi:hypothetical protein